MKIVLTIKKYLVVCLIVVLAIAVPASSKTWDGGGDGTSWSSANNWNPNGVPTTSDDVIINAPGTTIVGYEMTVSDHFATCDLQAGTYQGALYLGYDGINTLTVSGGTLNVGYFQVGRDYDATLTQDGGTVTGGSGSGGLKLGESSGFSGYGTYNMNGGTLDVDGTLTETNGEFNFYGGTIILRGGDYTGFNAANAWFNVLGSPYTEDYYAPDTVLSVGSDAVTIVETDNETWVWEDGTATDTYIVVLSSQPDYPVTITVDPDAESQVNSGGAGNPIDLTFTTANWDTAQIVTVDGIEDTIDPDGTEISIIGHTSSSNDSDYNGLSIPNVSVKVLDSANQYYNGFLLYGFWGDDPFVMEKLSHKQIGYNGFDANGNISNAAADWIDDVDYCHKYGVKAILGFNSDHLWGLMMDNADGSRTNFVSQLTQLLIDSDADGVDFDNEYGSFGPDYDALIVDCASAFSSYGFTVGADVYQNRAELTSTGLGAIDHLNLMAYDDLGQLQSMVDYWKGRGASDDVIMCGMADGWGDYNDQATAVAKTRFALDRDYLGVWLYRTNLDTLNVNTSLLEACSSTILNYDSEGVAKTWDGGGDGTNWSSAYNWNPDVVPSDRDEVVINVPGTTIVGDEMGVTDVFDTLDLQGGTYQGAVYHGYSASNGLTVSGGTLNATPWFQIGRNYDATLTQVGGTVIGDNDLVLGEGDFIGYGTYNMNGGLLEIAGTITQTNGEFNFSGGIITLDGDQVGFNAANAWFNVTGPNAGSYTETYDAGKTTLQSNSDFNDDKIVNLVDFAIFAGFWENGTADMADLSDFFADWLFDF